MFHVVFVSPRIPPNTGNAIRLAAVTGVHLHLIEPLGFELSDSRLRRAGLDYHDLARVTVHPSVESLWAAVLPAQVFAFTVTGRTRHTDVQYGRGDVLLFGPEPGDLPEELLGDANVTDRVRIPMLSGRRSLNLANCASIAIYEAWRQNGFEGA